MVLFEFKSEVRRHWSQKNNNRIRRAGKRIFIGKQEALINDKNYLTLLIKQAWQKDPINRPIHADIKFYFKDFYTAKGSMNMKLGDLDNLLCLPVDCLQSAGVIENDALIMSFDGSRKLPSERNYITITLHAYQQ